MKRTLMVLGVAAVLGLAASAGGEKKPERRAVNLPGRSADLPFSDAVLAGDTLYLSGKIGLDPKTGKPPESAEEEARLVLDDMKATLAAAGMTMDDLVTVTVYSPDVALWQRFNGVYRDFFKKELPARAFVGSGPLLFGARFEVQAIAVRR